MTRIKVCEQHNALARCDFTRTENLHLEQCCEFVDCLFARRFDVMTGVAVVGLAAWTWIAVAWIARGPFLNPEAYQ